MKDTISPILLNTESMLTLFGIVVTIIISTIAAIYAIITNTKKYELTENYRCELLSWYKSVVETMILAMRSQWHIKGIDILI